MINIYMRKVLDNFYVILYKKEYIKLQQIYMKYNKIPVGIETRYRYISDTLFWFISKLYTVMIWKTGIKPGISIYTYLERFLLMIKPLFFFKYLYN